MVRVVLNTLISMILRLLSREVVFWAIVMKNRVDPLGIKNSKETKIQRKKN